MNPQPPELLEHEACETEVHLGQLAYRMLFDLVHSTDLTDPTMQRLKQWLGADSTPIASATISPDRPSSLLPTIPSIVDRLRSACQNADVVKECSPKDIAIIQSTAAKLLLVHGLTTEEGGRHSSPTALQVQEHVQAIRAKIIASVSPERLPDFATDFATDFGAATAEKVMQNHGIPIGERTTPLEEEKHREHIFEEIFKYVRARILAEN